MGKYIPKTGVITMGSPGGHEGASPERSGGVRARKGLERHVLAGRL